MIAVCSRCGTEFDLAKAKRRIGRLYGAYVYEDYYPSEYVCSSCAIEEISPDYGSGEDQIDDMDLAGTQINKKGKPLLKTFPCKFSFLLIKGQILLNEVRSLDDGISLFLSCSIFRNIPKKNLQ